jgi:hypothetical protein
MKTRLFATATAAATATALFGFAGGAQAFSFGTNGMSFGKDTGIEFEFIQSNGWFKSSVAVYEVVDGEAVLVADLFREVKNSDNGSANGFLATIEGGAVEAVNTTVTFLANKVYTLGLTNLNPDNGKSTGTVYTMNSLNVGGGQRASFGATYSDALNGNDGAALAGVGDYQSSDNPFQAVTIGFEDNYWNPGDGDYNDFIITAKAPEPITIGGLALGGAGLFAARRRRQRKA